MTEIRIELCGGSQLHPHRPAAERKGERAMSTIYTNGTWKPNPGREEAFVETWSEFAAWASGMPGAGQLRLVRNLSEPERFTSFGNGFDHGRIGRMTDGGGRRHGRTGAPSQV